MFNPENRSDLEQALRKHLGRNAAPQDLWSRVEKARRAPATRRLPLPLAGRLTPALAVLTVAVGGWVLWQQFSKPQSVEALAVDALGRGPEHLQFRSDRAAEIRAWLRANAGLDVPLPPRHSPLIEIVGAAVIENQGRIAEIAYRVGDRNAALLVRKDPSGTRSYQQHTVRPSESFKEARVSSWSMRGQSYTLAWAAPGEFRVACLLCHGDEPRLTE